jgi:hypothetical protein
VVLFFGVVYVPRSSKSRLILNSLETLLITTRYDDHTNVLRKMAPPKKAVNLKQESGRAKKAENESKKQASADAQRSAQEEQEWSQGANVKRSAKEQEAALREEEAARKRREKAQLLAAEEADGPSTTSTAKKALQSAKKTKKKDDLSFCKIPSFPPPTRK